MISDKVDEAQRVDWGWVLSTVFYTSGADVGIQKVAAGLQCKSLPWELPPALSNRLSLALSAFDSFNCTKAQGRQLCFLTCSFLFMWCVCWEQLTVSPIIKQEGSWVVQEICATCSIRGIGILEEASEVLPPDSRILDVEVYYRRSTSSLTKLSSYLLSSHYRSHVCSV